MNNKKMVIKRLFVSVIVLTVLFSCSFKIPSAAKEENIVFHACDGENNDIWITRESAGAICSNYDADWNYDMIGVQTSIVNDEERDPITGDHTVKVAILDSGVDFSTCDSNITKTVNLVEEDQDLEPMLIDLTGHGSAIAGIISNINPEAEIYSVRVLDENNNATLSRAAQGIYWCIENNVNIINMSFGASFNSEILRQAIQAAYDNGILLIASAGNNPETEVEYPAKYSEVMAVGSVNPDGAKSPNNASGSEIELLAPGQNVFAQSMLGLYTTVNGTSVASAHVAGAASLLWQMDKSKSASFIRGLLTESSNKSISTESDPAGLLDVQYAVEMYDKYDPASGEGLPENNDEIGVDEDGDAYVDWGVALGYNGEYISLHKWLVELGIELLEDNQNYFTDEQVGVLKAGAVYPDRGNLSGSVPYHGRRTTNWIASYRYITAVAKAFRDSTGGTITYPNASDIVLCNYYTTQTNQIIHDFRYDSVSYYDDDGVESSKTWYYVVNHYGSSITDFDTRTETQKNYLKSLFIYGVALHDLTDTFAHASYSELNGNIVKIVHPSAYVEGENINGADDKHVCPKRWIDAKYASTKLINAAITSFYGRIAHFAPHVTTEYRGYYLHAPEDKACTINDNLTNRTIFDYINYGSYSAT